MLPSPKAFAALVRLLPPPAQDVLVRALAIYHKVIYPLLYPLRQLLLALLGPIITAITGNERADGW